MKAPFPKIKTAIVPIGLDKDDSSALAMAKALAGEVVLVGVVTVHNDEMVSAGARAARSVRKRLMELSEGPQVRFKSSIIVSETPWVDLQNLILHEKPELLVVAWKNGKLTIDIPVFEVLSNIHVNVLVVGGRRPNNFDKTLVAVRGGPHAELALKIAISMKPAQLDVLHISIASAQNDAPFKGYKRILSQLPQVNPRSIVTDDVSKPYSRKRRTTIWSSWGQRPAVLLVDPRSDPWQSTCCVIQKRPSWSPKFIKKRLRRFLTKALDRGRYRCWSPTSLHWP